MKNIDTKLQHADGHDEKDNSIAPAIYPTASFRANNAREFADMASSSRHPRYYTRYGNPTLERTAKLLAELEGGEACLLTASGMAAISTALIGLLKAGDHVVAQTSHYMGTTNLLTELLPRYGVRVSFVDQTSREAFANAIEPSTRLIMLETPANPHLALTDLTAVAELARKHSVITVADNTFASPVNQQPLSAGIDLVVHSATKYLGGHHDLTAGAIVGTEALIRQIWNTSIILGGTLAPHDAWLLLRGMRTLGVRLERINANAIRIASAFEGMSGIKAVHYPGLESHPQHRLARAQMSGFGGVIAVDVAGGYEAAERMMSRLQLFTQAVSLGGVESLAVHAAAMWAGTLSEQAMLEAGIEPGLVRLSIGLENWEDLLADIANALA